MNTPTADFKILNNLSKRIYQIWMNFPEIGLGQNRKTEIPGKDWMISPGFAIKGWKFQRVGSSLIFSNTFLNRVFLFYLHCILNFSVYRCLWVLAETVMVTSAVIKLKFN